MRSSLLQRSNDATIIVFALLAASSFLPANALLAPAFAAPVSAISEQRGTAPGLVPNFEKVSSGIWRGAVPSTDAMEALAHDGVKTIVDLRMDGSGVDQESTKAKALGVSYYHFPLGFAKPDESKLRDILAIMTEPANQPVFVHCRQGADRTGMLVGLYRTLWQNWSFPKVWAEMRQHGFKPFLLSMKHEVEFARSGHMMSAKQSAPKSIVMSPGSTYAADQSVVEVADIKLADPDAIAR